MRSPARAPRCSWARPSPSQLCAPRALRAWGYRPVLAAGCSLLGLPALVLLATIAPLPTLLVSAVRGVGFGLLTVTGSALVAELVPPHTLGRASGTFGAVVAGPQIVALPGGVALAQAWSTAPVFLLGALIPTLAAAGAALVPPVRTHAAPAESGNRLSPRALAVPLLALLVLAAAFGGITSLLPIAVSSDAGAAILALAALSAATVVGRYTSGIVAHRVAPGRQLAPASTTALIGLILVALAVRSPVGRSSWIGAVCIGAGFGVCQNDSLVTVFHRTVPHQRGSASAAWNIAFDGGTGAGALAMGVLATVVGYPWAFGAAALRSRSCCRPH